MGEAKRRKSAGDYGNTGRRRPRGPWPLIVALAALFALVGGLLYWLTNPAIAPTDDLPQAAAGTPPFPAALDRYGISIGSPQAPVVVREFADYQCPACARFADSVARLKEQYVDSGRVRLVFFDLPLEQHRNAVPAAMAARCARELDAYWPMHKRLFETQARWSDAGDPLPLFAAFAAELGLDRARFTSCMESGRYRDDIARSVGVATQLRIAATPTVFVDNVQLSRPGWYQLAGVVERALREPAE